MSAHECEYFIAETLFRGTPQEVVTLYFYSNEQQAQETYDRTCPVGLGATIRLCKMIKERDLP